MLDAVGWVNELLPIPGSQPSCHSDLSKTRGCELEESRGPPAGSLQELAKMWSGRRGKPDSRHSLGKHPEKERE